MIPKIIHYCWFGKQPLDEKAKKCIQSWRKFFPDYEIKQWNEDNFDITSLAFMKHAYEDKKWAFVSDVARLMIIYEHGGIYFDTDVEVIASYDDILKELTKGFMGFESTGLINTGLGFGAEKGHPFLRELLTKYVNTDYSIYRDNLSDIACTIITTDLLCANGLKQNNEKQTVCELDIYPAEFFSPIDYHTGKLKRCKKTHSIHWYSATWKNAEEQSIHRRYQVMNRIFGRRISDIMLGVWGCVKQEGIMPYLKKRTKKYFLMRKE